MSGNRRRYSISSSVSCRDWPSDSPRRLIRPMRVRTSSVTLCPSRANTRRIWRFRPSRSVISRSDRMRPRFTTRTWAGRVRPSARYTPRISRRTTSGVAQPSTVATYVLGASYRGWVSRLAKSPSLVMRSRPLDSVSSRPTENSRARVCGMRSIGRRRPAGSKFVQTTPLGLLSIQYSGRSGRRRDPSRRTSCVVGSALVPSWMTVCPSTVTRPSRMMASQALREATPARARSF